MCMAQSRAIARRGQQGRVSRRIMGDAGKLHAMSRNACQAAGHQAAEVLQTAAFSCPSCCRPASCTSRPRAGC